MTYALDVSQYTPPEQITDDVLDRCIARGIDRFIVSTLDQDIARKQIERLARKPIEIQTYRAYNWGNIRNEQPQDVAFIGEIRRNVYDVQKHYIDAEAGLSDNPANNISTMHWAIKSFEGICPTELYTAPYIWEQYFNNTAEFNFMGMWFAHWNGDDSLDMQHPFGGWTRGTMHQTLNDLHVEGIWCDTNYYERPTPPPAPPPGPPPLPPLEHVSSQLVEIRPGLYEVRTRIRQP